MWLSAVAWSESSTRDRVRPHHLENAGLPVKNVEVVFRIRFVIVAIGEESKGASDDTNTDEWVNPWRFFHK